MTSKEQVLMFYFKFNPFQYVDTFDKSGNKIPELCGKIVGINDNISMLPNYSVRVFSEELKEQFDGTNFEIGRVEKMNLHPRIEDQIIFAERFKNEGLPALSGQVIKNVTTKDGDTLIELEIGCIVEVNSGYDVEFDTSTYIVVTDENGNNY